MNRILLFLCLACSAFADTWKSDQQALNLSGKSAYSHGRWRAAIVKASDGSVVTTVNEVNGTADSYSATLLSKTYPYDFYVVVASGNGTLTTGNPSTLNDPALWVKWMWFSAYKVDDPNEPQSSSSGPYDNSGNPTNPDGTPADPITAAPPNNSYKASIEISCAAGAPQGKLFRITGTATASPSVIYQSVESVAPGETRTINVTADQPFTLSKQEVLENLAFDPELSPGSPDDDNRYTPIGNKDTVTATGQTADPPATTQATSDRTSGPSSGSPAAAAKNTMSTATTGGTSKDLSDLSTNLSNELQRVAEQVRMSGDGTRAAIEDSNKKLDDLRNGSGSVSDTGQALGTLPGSVGDFTGSIGAKAAGLADALTGLANAAGLSTGPGSASLAWSIPVMGHVVTVTAEPFADVIAGVRSAILWIAGIFFLWSAFGIIRGAFVDEGK